MEITVSSRHTEVSEALRASATEKIDRLTRFLEGMDHAEIHFSQHRSSRNPDREVCEVTLHGHGHHVRCKVAAPDGFAAVDRAVEKLEHQLHKLKSKLVSRSHTNGKRPPKSDGVVATLPETVVRTSGVRADADQLRIVKTKAFAIKPMAPPEAVMQMDLLGHDFFFFTNAETDRAAVVYRRDDGDVGLIDEAS
ncbi:MAG: ribosome hibernation-promoting factor, HPF/YfiA family [Acidimicrobiales bacterium]